MAVAGLGQAEPCGWGGVGTLMPFVVPPLAPCFSSPVRLCWHLALPRWLCCGFSLSLSPLSGAGHRAMCPVFTGGTFARWRFRPHPGHADALVEGDQVPIPARPHCITRSHCWGLLRQTLHPGRLAGCTGQSPGAWVPSGVLVVSFAVGRPAPLPRLAVVG